MINDRILIHLLSNPSFITMSNLEHHINLPGKSISVDANLPFQVNIHVSALSGLFMSTILTNDLFIINFNCLSQKMYLILLFAIFPLFTFHVNNL